jgi:hypothetical protein
MSNHVNFTLHAPISGRRKNSTLQFIYLKILGVGGNEVARSGNRSGATTDLTNYRLLLMFTACRVLLGVLMAVAIPKTANWLGG